MNRLEPKMSRTKGELVPGRRILILLALLVTALALVGAGCGGDDDGGAAAPPPAEPAEPPAEEPAEPPAEEPAAGATELQLAADPDGNLAYDQTSLEAPAGDIAIVLTNESPVPHNVAIEDSGGSVLAEGEIFSGGGTRTTTATLAAGDYTFFCSVPGHREAGMEGTLTAS
jgi:plastocyanin